MHSVLQPVAMQVAEAEPAAAPQQRRFRPGAAFQIGPDCPPPPISPDPVEGCADFYEGLPFAMTPEKDEDGYYDICSMYATDVCYDEEVDIYSSYHALDEAIPDSDEPSDLQGVPSLLPTDISVQGCTLTPPANLSGATGNSVPAPSPKQTAPMNGTSGGSGSKPSGEALHPEPQNIPETGANGSPAQFVLEMGVEPGSAPQEGRVEEPDDTPTPKLSGPPTGEHVYSLWQVTRSHILAQQMQLRNCGVLRVVGHRRPKLLNSIICIPPPPYSPLPQRHARVTYRSRPQSYTVQHLPAASAALQP